MAHKAELFYELIRRYVIYKFPDEIQFEPEKIMSFGFRSGFFGDVYKEWSLLKVDVKRDTVFEEINSTYHFTDPDGEKKEKYDNKDSAYYNGMILAMLTYMTENEYLVRNKYNYLAKDKILKIKKLDIAI